MNPMDVEEQRTDAAPQGVDRRTFMARAGTLVAAAAAGTAVLRKPTSRASAPTPKKR